MNDCRSGDRRRSVSRRERDGERLPPVTLRLAPDRMRAIALARLTMLPGLHRGVREYSEFTTAAVAPRGG